MDADPAAAAYVVEHDGRRIGFCSAGCRGRFLAEPAAYLAR
jgi:P-type Cu+ transporter